MKKALDVALDIAVAVTLAAERVARRGREASRTLATLRNALDAGEPEWRVKPRSWIFEAPTPDELLRAVGGSVRHDAPLCKWCVRSVAVSGDVCAECAEESRRHLGGLGWDARKGNAS